MVATLHAEPGARPGVDNLILVSSDTHIGPLMSQLREYCPQQYLDDFDAFAAQMQAQSDPTGAGELREAMAHLSLEEKEALLAQLNDPNGTVAQYMRNRRTPGHHDMNVRLDDMDRDGLACEIIFHGSQNGEPIPFVVPHDLPAGLTTPFSFEGLDLELAYAGIHMYNQWLADQVSIQPERHVGLAYIPAWDPELTVQGSAVGARCGAQGREHARVAPGDADPPGRRVGAVLRDVQRAQDAAHQPRRRGRRPRLAGGRGDRAAFDGVGVPQQAAHLVAARSTACSTATRISTS